MKEEEGGYGNGHYKENFGDGGEGAGMEVDLGLDWRKP